MYAAYRIVTVCIAIPAYILCTVRSVIRHRFPSGFLRMTADFLIFLGFFLSPLYGFWFSRFPESYAGFVIRFSELVFITVILSLIVDRIARQKTYRQEKAGRDRKRNDLKRDMVSVITITCGLLLFEGFTALLYWEDAPVLLQILLPAAALLLYRFLFLLIGGLHDRRHKTRHKAERPPQVPPKE